MILFHGSYVEVSAPSLAHSRTNVDFGRGFYLTQLDQQARAWAARFKRNHDHAVLSRYTLDDAALQQCRVKQFAGLSGEWFDFITACRTGQDDTDFDIVIGPVADDRVFNTLELYLEGLISKDAAIQRLRYLKPNAQLCIRSQAVLDRYLHFEGSDMM